MTRAARIAVGTIQPGVEGAAIIWALLDVLTRLGLRVQDFQSKACFAPRNGATAITGLCPRHLDSWLMSPDVCRELLLRGAGLHDLALVEGRFDSATRPDEMGGRLDTLCDWLNLPRLAIVDASRLNACQLPPRPKQVDGLLLDRVADSAHRVRLQTLFESMWGVPVLGSLDELPVIRDLLSSTPPGSQPSLGLCRSLGNHFACNADLDRILDLARSRDLTAPSAERTPPRVPMPAVRVAVAFDEAFHCYFPDTLDLLELHGASICEFSPLQDERLPPQSDIVYFGCGHPEEFARELEQNRCMMLALHNHLCQGYRIYAEGGGLAYLCQHIEMPDGSRLPMVGALPAVAQLNPAPEPPRATEVTLTHDNWLGPAGSRWRGYLNTRWSLEATGPLHFYARDAEGRLNLVGRHQAIGSRLHLNFAAQSLLLDRFFLPHAAAIDVDASLVRTS